MITLDSAPLPPAKKGKVDSVSALQGWQAAIKATTEAALSEGSGAMLVDYDSGSDEAAVYVNVIKAGQTLLVGGPMNGKRVDLSKLGDGLIVRVPYKRDPESWTTDAHLWYERGDQPGADARYYCGHDCATGVEILERILTRS